MVAIIPAPLVAKPTPEFPLRYGLFQAAIGPLPFPDIHMRGGGLKYWETMCGGGTGYEIECIDALDTKVFNSAGLNVVTGVPFVVRSNFTCSPVGLSDAELDDLARQKFHSVEQATVESIFDSGDFAQAPALANNPAVVNLSAVSPNAVTPVDVISILERAMYCTSQYGPPAYLHMPIPVFNRLKQEHLIEFDGLRWRTPMGSVISAGCYAGLTPAGAAPAEGTFWVYATGQTVVWRTGDGEEFVAPVEAALNRTTNQYTGLVEREYVVTFECAVYAKPVTLWAP
jgi:hypothetical protein